MTILRWGLAIILAGFFIMMGAQKFGAHNPVFQYMAEQSGIGLFEPGVRMITGLGEVTAALMILWPRTRILGALLALALLAGALTFHLSPWLGINAPVAFAEDGSYVKSPMLFIMAVSFFFASLGMLFVERTEQGKAKLT